MRNISAEGCSVLLLSKLIQFGPLTKKGDIEAIEKVQKRATKLVISLKKLPYKERLLKLNLHTLKYRRLHGDMIEVYKITHDMYDRSVALQHWCHAPDCQEVT